MMVEQIAMAHHTIGCLNIRAARAETLEQAKVYNAAAARLLGEFRRIILALKKYREPTPPQNFMLVRQQNVAQHQQVAYVEGERASGSGRMETPGTPKDALRLKEEVERLSMPRRKRRIYFSSRQPEGSAVRAV